MAQIREFTIEGLAGRAEPYSVALNPDVNIFFGLNGSGKTTLLKVLHSALSTETDILNDVTFKRAAVKVFLNRYRLIRHKNPSRLCSHSCSTILKSSRQSFRPFLQLLIDLVVLGDKNVQRSRSGLLDPEDACGRARRRGGGTE